MFPDIVDGNLKAVMRLILALAAHYKPANIRHYATGSTSGSGGAASSRHSVAGFPASVTRIAQVGECVCSLFKLSSSVGEFFI